MQQGNTSVEIKVLAQKNQICSLPSFNNPSTSCANDTKKGSPKSSITSSSAKHASITPKKSSPSRKVEKFLLSSVKIKNPWTQADEEKIQELIHLAKKYRFLCSECSTRYHNIDTGMTIPTLVLNALIVALNSFSVISKFDIVGIQVATIVCTLLMTSFYSMEKKYQFSKRAEKYHALSISFMKCGQLASDILLFPREQRKLPYKCISDLQSEINDLLSYNMYIPDHIEKRFQDKKQAVFDGV